MNQEVYLDKEGKPIKPFVSKTLDEEREPTKGVVFTLRMNDQEWERLQEAKDWFDTDQNSTAVKILAEIGYNVLQGQLSKETLAWLFKKDRVRSSDFRAKR